MTEKHQCAEQVWHPQGNWGSHYPCQRNAAHQEDDKWWCSTHAPTLVEAKRDAADAKYKAEWAARDKAFNLTRLRNVVIDRAKDWQEGKADAEAYLILALAELRRLETQ